MKMRTIKPILGRKEVVILDTTKKGTEDRFTITIEMQVKDTDRTFKDVLFYDAANTNRTSVLPAILCALAEQTELPIEEFRTENDDEYNWDEDKVLSHIKGKTITVERTQVVSERNGQVYYNVNYRPETQEAEVEL
jgi:hypothetical protein